MALDRVLYMLSGYGIAPNTFTRSGSVGPYTDSDGILKSAAANVYRREWLWRDTWALGNLPDTPALLIEPARTNIQTVDDLTSWSSVWTPVVTSGVSDPAGGTGAYRVADDSALVYEYIYRAVTFTGNAVKTVVWVLRETDNPATAELVLMDTTAGAERLILFVDWVGGVPSATTEAGLYLGTRYVGNGYWALYTQTTSVTAANSHQLWISPTDLDTDTGSLDVYRVNVYDALQPGLSILDASETRNADVMSAPFAYAPQAMTIYLDFLEGESPSWTGGEYLLNIGGTSGSVIEVYRGGGGNSYVVLHAPGGGVSNVSSSVSPTTPALTRVELRAVLYADGSVVIGLSQNGGAETVGTTSAAARMGSTWGNTTLNVGSRVGDFIGVQAFAAIKIVAGVKTLTEMRALNPACVIGGYAMPVREDVREERIEVGDRGRSFDGTLRETIRARLGQWEADTTPLTISDTNLAQAVLESSTQPQTVFGTMFQLTSGAIPAVNTRVSERGLVQSGTDRRWSLKFTAEQSS